MLYNELFISLVSVISQKLNDSYDNYVISLFLFYYVLHYTSVKHDAT